MLRVEGGSEVRLHLQRVRRHEWGQVPGWRHGDTRAPRTLAERREGGDWVGPQCEMPQTREQRRHEYVQLYPQPPACPIARCPWLLWPRGAWASLGPRIRGHRHRPQPLVGGWGRWAWAQRQSWSGGCPVRSKLSLPGASRVSTQRGCPTTAGGALWVCRRCLGPVAVELGPPGFDWVRWACRCEGVSAPGMHVGVWAQSSGILFAGPWQWVFRWDSLLFPKAFWRIRYKRLKFTFIISCLGHYWMTVTNSRSASRRLIRDILTPKQSFKKSSSRLLMFLHMKGFLNSLFLFLFIFSSNRPLRNGITLS